MSMDKTSFELFVEGVQTMGLPIWVGVAVAITIFVIELKLVGKGLLLSRSERKRDNAIKRGHVVTGNLVHFSRLSYDDRSSYCIGTYEYEIDSYKGKKRILVYSSACKPQLLLYYGENPKKVFSDYDVSGCSVTLMVYLVPLAAAVFVVKLMGFNP